MRKTLAAVLALAFFGVAACGGGGDQTASQQSAGDSGQQQAAAQQQGGQTGGGESGEESGGQQQAGELTMPDWISVDEQNETVTLDLVAGSSSANNNWNFNGYYANGNNARVVVPQGYEVTINFENQDDLSPHSVGIDAEIGDYPPTFQNVEPVFDGAVSSGATSMSDATQPGQSESFTFTASEAGDYAMVCYLPGHATAGMWIHFRVSAEGEAGLQEL